MKHVNLWSWCLTLALCGPVFSFTSVKDLHLWNLMLRTNPLVAGEPVACAEKSNLSDWSRCRVLILNGSWLIMHRPWNWPTVRPLHSAVYNMCGTWEPKIWKFSETLFGEVRGWKTVRWPYRYLGRRQSLNICVNPSSCESRIRFPWDCI